MKKNKLPSIPNNYNSYKPILAIFLMLAIVCINPVLVHAEVFTFDNVKSYDANTQTITIKNLFGLGDTYADIQLLTPLNNHVTRGDDVLVAQYKIVAYKDYLDAIKGMKYYALNEDGKEIERKIVYKILQTSEEDIDDYDIQCTPLYLPNGTQYDANCVNVLIGSHTEIVEDWKVLNNVDIKEGETYILGLFTEVEAGDVVEWIPQDWFGINKITEWAIWTEDLNVGLTHYYKFDETTGTTAIDSVNNQNGTLINQTELNVDGKIGTSYFFNGTSQYVNFTSKMIDYGNFSVSGWLYPTTYMTGAVAGSMMGQSQANPIITAFVENNKTNFRLRNSAGGNLKTITATSTVSLNTWYHFVITYNNITRNMSLYHNGVLEASDIYGGGDFSTSPNSYIGANGFQGANTFFLGRLDEIGYWNRTLSQSEITDLYNGGDGITYGATATNPSVILNSPENYFNTSVPTLTFNVTALDYNSGGGIANVSLYVDEILESINTSGVNGTYIFTKVMSAGVHNWSILAYNINSTSNQSDTRYFNLTILSPDITLNSPVNYFNTSNPSITFDADVTDNLMVENVSLYIDNILNETNTSHFNGTYTFAKTLNEGNHNWSILAYDNESNPSQSATRYLTIDLTAPVVTIVIPENTTYYTNITKVNNVSESFNWLSTDLNLDSCWYSLDDGATNNTVVCDANYTDYFTYGQQTFTAWANDSAGNVGVARQSATWDYHTFENSRIFPAVATEGSVQSYFLNLTAHTSLTGAYLNYGGTRYPVSINVGDFTLLNSTIIIPSVDSNSQVTILWEINVGEGYFNSSSNITNVTNMAIDNCTINKIKLMEYTMRDEISQYFLNTTLPNASIIYNTSAKLNMQVYAYGLTGNAILNYSVFMNRTNPFAICINDTLNSGEKYSFNFEVEYKSNSNETSHAKEYYHLQNETLDTDFVYENYTLYDLDTTNAQTFRIYYRDASYLPIDNALIVIQRKYVDEGIYKTVEIPITSYDGSTTASLETDDVIYSFWVYKNGVFLDSFQNKYVTCENAPIGDCEIKLYSFASPIIIENYTGNEEVAFTISYNRSSRTAFAVFSISSGNSSTMVFNGTLFDNLGNQSICGQNTLTAVSGTLTCTIPASIGNGSAIVTLYKDNIEVGSGQVKLERIPSEIFGNSQVFLLIFLYLILIGIAVSGSPVITGVFLILGVILGVVLNLVTASGLIGYGATALWFIIAVILVLIKGAKRQ